MAPELLSAKRKPRPTQARENTTCKQAAAVVAGSPLQSSTSGVAVDFTGQLATTQTHRELTALVFIRVVSAVVVIVTLPAPRNASIVLAAELIWLARSLVWVSDTHSRRGTVSPDRLLFFTSVIFQLFLTALFFWLIGSVAAVVFAVAFPARGNAAARVFAAELIHATCHLGCNKHDR